MLYHVILTIDSFVEADNEKEVIELVNKYRYEMVDDGKLQPEVIAVTSLEQFRTLDTAWNEQCFPYSKGNKINMKEIGELLK